MKTSGDSQSVFRKNSVTVLLSSGRRGFTSTNHPTASSLLLWPSVSKRSFLPLQSPWRVENSSRGWFLNKLCLFAKPCVPADCFFAAGWRLSTCPTCIHWQGPTGSMQAWWRLHPRGDLYPQNNSHLGCVKQMLGKRKTYSSKWWWKMVIYHARK